MSRCKVGRRKIKCKRFIPPPSMWRPRVIVQAPWVGWIAEQIIR